MSRLRAPLALLVLVLSVPVAHAGAPGRWLVDAAGGGDFTTIQAAIDAAAPGDLVLVRPGFYAKFELAGKGLAIVGLEGAGSVHTVDCIVRDVPADQSVLLRHLDFQADAFPTSTADGALHLLASAGTIWVEGCSAVLGIPISGSVRDVLTVESCSSVTLIDVHASALRGIGVPEVATPALRMTDATVHVYDSSFEAPHGATPTGVGGAGAWLLRSFLYASGSTFRGGDGGDGGFCAEGGDGGPGLHVTTNRSFARLLDCTTEGGEGGAGATFCGPLDDGDDGVPIQGLAFVELLAGTARTFALDPMVGVAQDATVTASGAVGETLFVLLSFAPKTEYLPLHLGTQLVEPPLQVIETGVVPAGGTLTTSLAPPPPVPGADFSLAFLQGFFVAPSGDARLGSGATLLFDTTACLHEATVATRNGGTNPASYTATPAVLGGVVDVTVDLTTTGHANALVFALDTPASIPLGSGQTLLVLDGGGSGELFGLAPAPGPLVHLGLPVPDVVGLCGLHVCSQAVHFGGVFPFALSNAQDLVLGGL